MKHLIPCECNFDNCCVELKFTDGSMISVDTIAVENEVADNIYQRSELDYLIYNDPLGYLGMAYFMNMLKKLYNGEIYMVESSAPKTQEYKKALRRLSETSRYE